MGYTVITIYRVAAASVAAFLRMEAAAARIYKREGALDDATYRPDAAEKLYGSMPLLGSIELAAGEVALLGVTAFRDRADHDAVMARIDADPEIDALFAEVQRVIALDRVLRGAIAIVWQHHSQHDEVAYVHALGHR